MYVIFVGFQIVSQKNNTKQKTIAPYAGGGAIFVLCFVVYTFWFRNSCVVLQ
jgi:hypothetical protein